MAEVSGQDLLDIANGCWNEKRQEYRGFQYNIAVGQAKRGIEKVKGERKERLAEARHQVSVLFDHSRRQTPKRLGSVAYEAGIGSGNDLTEFATEVTELLNGPHNGGFGVIDPAMITGLIMAIINAIKACKQVIPTPTPVIP